SFDPNFIESEPRNVAINDNFNDKNHENMNVEVDEANHELMDNDDKQARILVLELKCTEPGCSEMLPDYGALYGHLDTDHKLDPHPCLAQGCFKRFKNR